MKTLSVALTVNIEIIVPDDSPVTPEKFASIFEWKVNDHTDGRHPFSAELVFDGVERACGWVIEEVLFHHFHDIHRDAIQGANTTDARRTVGFKMRDQDIENAIKPIRRRLVEAGRIEVAVKKETL